ncbi:unnamed protein product [Rotaria magnacalcarata]|nr:unnamed protein product [Rotaria magnacalcarata]CAF2246890.1 unnamed protein product [Rotaria magnacalcarata]CAF3868286.1 unnamed protein product [Rotaria magnacalcarata]CAF4204790.1 unnamed protein product [Rotaria magnacalcarata]
MRGEIRSMADRITCVERSKAQQSPFIPTTSFNVNSRPASSHSVEGDFLTANLSESLHRAQAEDNRLMLKLATAHSALNINQNTSCMTQFLSPYQTSSAFQPIQKPVSDRPIHIPQASPSVNIATPNVIMPSSPLFVPPTILPISSSLSPTIPPLILTTSTPVHKFIQKLRSDIRSRLDLDISLPIRELVRKTQTIESNIEQQKVDEKLKLAATQEKTHFTSFTTNSISFTNTNRQRAQAPLTALISSIRSNDHKGNHDQRVRNNNNASGNKHNPARTYNRSFSKEILFN